MESIAAAEPSEEQQAVVDAGVDERILVIAGPGTGKTHTLQRRLTKLVEQDDVAAGYIVVLSFSRAAVGEVRRRLRASGTDAARVRTVTFDSFATSLLANNDPDGDWVDASYEGRIEAAINQIDQFDDDLGDYEHICIDEVQDLVGVRMRFVQALLNRLDAGFTLLGDPAQGIYDFQLEDDETPEEHGSPAFFAWLGQRFGAQLQRLTLTHNYRAASDFTRRACAVGLMLQGDPTGGLHELQDIFDDCTRVPAVETFGRPLPDGGRTAILCRTNGQVLAVSRSLAERGIAHNVQRPATERMISPWVAQLLARNRGGLISKDRLEETLVYLGGPDIEQVWVPLRRVARDGRDVDLDLLRLRLTDGVVPDELHEQQPDELVVSTIHRAKGLEFQRVAVLNQGWDKPYDDAYQKSLFVAMSRAIRTLAVVGKPDIGGGPVEKHKYLDRWYHRGHKPWQRFGVELRQDDVHFDEPYGADADEVLAVQDILLNQAATGDEIQLVFQRRDVSGERPVPRYGIEWNGQRIGRVSHRFSTILFDLLKKGGSGPSSFPAVIDKIQLDGVRTVVGDPNMTDQKGLGRTGAWVAPSLAGLGSFDWNNT